MTKKQYEDEVERLAPSLRRIAYSIVRNEHDAQDAVQQALLAVWARRECVEFARLKPYLTRAVMNACRDIQRARQKAIPMKEMPEMSYQPPDGMLADAVELNAAGRQKEHNHHPQPPQPGGGGAAGGRGSPVRILAGPGPEVKSHGILRSDV